MMPLPSYGFIAALARAGCPSRDGVRVYLVGGSVRDHLLGRPQKDFDLVVTGLEIEPLSKILRALGTVNLVGKSFGVIKFRPQEDPEVEFDIALPRVERSTGTGHRDFSVHSDPHLNIETDLLRRDFTINAMALDLTQERRPTGEQLIDPYGGQADLKAGLIRVVFENSFREDPLRLLRAVQFAARLEFTIEPLTFSQLRDEAALIQGVAKERVTIELKKLLEARRPSLGFDLMRGAGLLKFVLPEVDNMIGVTQPQKNNEDVYTHTMKVLDAARSATELAKPGDLDIMLSALFHDAGKPATRREGGVGQRVTFFNHQHVSTRLARRWLKDYKVTTIGADPERICHLVRHHMFETKPFQDNERAIRRFINKVGKDYIDDLLDLRLADKKGGKFPDKVYGILKLREKIHDEIRRESAFCVKDLKLNGFDIMALGYQAGPVIGRIQGFLLNQVLVRPELNDKETLTQLIRNNAARFSEGGHGAQDPVDAHCRPAKGQEG